MPPIDARAGASYALSGKVVTMNPAGEVIDRGVVYIAAGRIVAMQGEGSPPPDGFAGTPQIATGGTIYPGLIELHNHLSYNVLPLWKVPKRFDDREQWRGHPDRRRLISGPMELLTDSPGYSAAVVRYVEAKCLLSGTTTSQGLTLSSDSGIPSLYRGEVRNVERPGHPALPAAATRIADVDSAEQFAARLARGRVILHLSEGTETRARRHFAALQQADGTWAISPNLIGIHAVGLRETDLQLLADHGASVVWSPLSNLLLYGETLKIQAAKACGLRIALGSDWSPTGSKNLLGELKVAFLESERQGGVFTRQELVAMATIEAARVLGWEASLGSIEVGKIADLLIIHRSQGDPYRRLLASDELAVKLVVIDGVPRYGYPALMRRFAGATERITLGGIARDVHLADPAGSAVLGGVGLGLAHDRLRAGLAGLPSQIPPLPQPPVGADGLGAPNWRLVLDEDAELGVASRPLAPLSAAAVIELLLAASQPLTEVVGPVALDELTVAEDPSAFLARLDGQPNLPAPVAAGLRKLYSR
jgi:5-methylthioadenosine/S-adenosylhomocysteine deaminase